MDILSQAQQYLNSRRGNVVALFPRRERKGNGLFWARPLAFQHQRIRELARARLTAAQIAVLVHLSEPAVQQIIEARA